MSDLVTNLRICVRLAQAAARTPEQLGSVSDSWDFVNNADWLTEMGPAAGADPETGLIAFARTDLAHLRDTLILASRAARSLDAHEILDAITGAVSKAEVPGGAWLDPRKAGTAAVRNAAGSLRANAEMVIAGDDRKYGYDGP